MATRLSALQTHPCLVAIILVAETRAGSQIVFHYPPTPAPNAESQGKNTSWYGTPAPASDLSSQESDTDSDGGRYDEVDSCRSSAARNSSRKDASASVRSVKTRTSGPAGARVVDVDEEMPERLQYRPNDQELNGHYGRQGISDLNKNNPWDHILGFESKALSKLLTPTKAFNRQRFEFGLERLVFLGAPRFIREDGTWKKKKKKKTKKKKKQKKKKEESELRDSLRDDVEEEHALADKTSPVVAKFSVAASGDSRPEALVRNEDMVDDSDVGSNAGSETRSTSTTEHGQLDNGLTMFNIVFVMNPTAIYYQARVDEMYHHVVKKFAKALEYAQAVHDYVYQESRAILVMKQKAEEHATQTHTLWTMLTQHSSLARAIMDAFNSLSEDGIAHVDLGQDLVATFQLRQPMSTSSVPRPTEPQIPGLWLTTTAPWEEDETDGAISPYCALLLLQDDAALLREVRSDAKELLGPLTYLISNLTPEKSLLKIAQKSSLTIKDVQVMARHLVFWRRGRAIPPLRERDTYIVSPNADISRIKSATVEFATKFPVMGSLPAMLSLLSQTPRPWNHFFPSRDHRQPYMEILAWLLRYGWVTQLRTFAWIRVSADIKTKVAKQIEAEKRQSQAMSTSVVDSIDISTLPSDSGMDRRRPEEHSIQHMFSPRLLTNSSGSASPSEIGSISSGRTAVTVVPQPPPFLHLSRSESEVPSRPSSRLTTNKMLQEEQGSSRDEVVERSVSRAGSKSPAAVLLPEPVESVAGSTCEMTSSGASRTHDTAVHRSSIIKSPEKASALELKWIECIGLGFNDVECAELWPVLIKYFDGKHAFEDIYFKEGLKKKQVAAVLSKLCAEGWLLTIRHW